MKNKHSPMFHLLALWLAVVCFPACQIKKEHQGKKVYEEYCVACHQPGGEGLGGLYPPLKASDYWQNHLDEVPCIIRHGLQDTIQVNGKTYTTPMAGIQNVTEFEIANVINYINATWYPSLPQQDIKWIRQQLEDCR